MKPLYLLAAFLIAGSAGAQQAPAPAPPAGAPPAGMPAQNMTPHLTISAAEIADRISQAQAAYKAGTTFHAPPLLSSGPFRASLEYHTIADTSYAVHETAAELFVVLDGSGTLSFGGTLVGPTTRRGTNLRADNAQGAIPYKIAKGDMAIVPENTPHAITQVDGVLVLMTLHMPIPPPGTMPGAPAPPAGTPPPPAQ